MRLKILPLLAILALFFPSEAYAANCANPSEPEGNLLCNKDYHVLQYCDGTNWIPAGRAGLDSGLVGWWTLNDGSGGTAADASGNGNNGTVDGASWTTGQLGGALDFDGVDDYVDAGDIAVTDNLKAITVSAWIYSRGLPAGMETGIVSKYDAIGGPKQYLLYYSDTGTVSLCVMADDCVDSATTISSNTWAHVTGTYDGATLKIFVNGVADGSAAFSGGIAASSSEPLYIGKRRDTDTSWTQEFNGLIDDVRIYNRALSVAEVYALYQNGTASSPCTASTECTLRYNANARTLEYCNSAAWQGVGQIYTAWGVNVDGTNDYLTRGADLTTSADSRLATGSFWFRRNGGNGTQQVLWCTLASAGSCRFQIDLGTGNQLHLLGLGTTGTTILNATGSTAITDTNWHHVMFSVDLADSARRHIYLDGAAETPTWTTYTNAVIDFTRTNHSVGAFTNGNNKFNGDLADFYLDMGTYTDLSVASRRELFRDANGKPVDLGYDGSAPGGTVPEVFLSDGTLSTWPTNKGSGGGFTVNGALTESTGTDGAGGIRRGLAGHWKLDEGSGTTAVDYSGSGLNGSLAGNAAWAAGYRGGAVSLDGNGDYVLVPFSAALPLNHPVTVTAFVKRNTSGSFMSVVQFGKAQSPGWSGWAVELDETGRIEFNNGIVGILSTNAIADGKWYFIAVSAASSTSRLFYAVDTTDGSVDINETETTSLVLADSDDDLKIGAFKFEGILGVDYFDGLIDDVRIYNRVLSAVEVAALYANAVCTGPAGQEGTFLYNGDHHVLQYCDGLTWRGVGK